MFPLPALRRDLTTLAFGVTLGACSPAPERQDSGVRVGRAVLTRAAKNPMALAVAPSGSVYFIERTGELRLYDAARGSVRDALVLAVDASHESGLLGLALSPDFAADGWVYLYYSAPLVEPLPEGVPPGRNVLVRYRARADGSLDPLTREELLAVPSERRCCHEGGSLAFMPDGTLLLSTGDNTDPFQAEGAAPLDARPGREVFDARRTAGNPFDLRGKLLRIAADGSVPTGNRFPPDGSLGRPEIHSLGVRNPFRLAVDGVSGRIFVGDIGPDAREDSPRGPRGFDELNVADAPSDFGWPTCIAKNLPYANVDFATGAVGEPFDCSEKSPAAFAYDYDGETPALGSAFGENGEFFGRAVIAGAVYRAPEGAPFAFPRKFEGALLFADWTRDRLASARLGDAGELTVVERLFASETFHRPIDVEVGPDGAVYVLEYGSGYWGDNADAALSRVELGSSDALSPIGVIEASTMNGAAPLDVTFSGVASHTADGERVAAYEWDLDGDGAFEARGESVTRRFDVDGAFSVALSVVSPSGRRSRPVARTIVVGNAPPSVRILAPSPGAVAVPGQPLALLGEATDPEDGVAPCDELEWTVSLGHNAHAHPAAGLSGCEAVYVPEIGEHAASPADRLFLAIELVHTDRGGPSGEAPLTARQGIRVDLAP